MPEVNAPSALDEIERAILSGQFKPRERLVETDLMTRFGFGRAKIREALKELELKGLVRNNFYRGAVVADLTVEEVEAIYFVRIILEKAAARLILKVIKQADIRNLKKILNNVESHMQRKSEQMFEKDSEFHRAIFRICGNECLYEMIDSLNKKAHIVRYNAWFSPQRIEQSIQEHREIISAIEKDDRLELDRLIGKHLMSSKNTYLSKWK